MIWLTWRQQRTQTAAVLAAIAAFGVVLLATAHGVRELTRSASAYDLVSRSDRDLYYAGIAALAVVPTLVGALWGAPLVARELESGTYRLVWSQGVTRTRWLAVRLGATALGAAVAVGALSALVTWWSGPLDGAESSTHGAFAARIAPIPYGMRDVVPVAYVLLALALGTLVGLVVRRSLAAVVITVVVMTAIQIAVPLLVRPHLAPTRSSTVALTSDDITSFAQSSSGATSIQVTAPPGSWVLTNRTVDAAGHAVPLPSWFGSCLPQPDAPTPAVVQASPRAGLDACIARLAVEGYRQHLVVQPASAFWRLQWTETGLVLVVAGAVTAVAFRRLRRVE